MATDYDAALRRDMERLNAAAQPLYDGMVEAMKRVNEICRPIADALPGAYAAANIALMGEWARMLRAPVESPSLEALSARLAYHAEKARLEQAAWADYQWRKAHPWRARMRAFGRYADRVRQDSGVIDGFDRIWYS